MGFTQDSDPSAQLFSANQVLKFPVLIMLQTLHSVGPKSQTVLLPLFAPKPPTQQDREACEAPQRFLNLWTKVGESFL